MQKNFSYFLAVDDISSAEKEYKIAANSTQLKQIAEILKVPAVKEFMANIWVCRKNKSTLLDVWGVVNAVVTRQSVISLDEFDKGYEIDFAMQFDTSLTDAQVRELEENGETNIPDVVMGGGIDLCQIALERLALDLEDYPRRDGESFNFVSEFNDADIKQENPFKILEKLKK